MTHFDRNKSEKAASQSQPKHPASLLHSSSLFVWLTWTPAGVQGQKDALLDWSYWGTVCSVFSHQNGLFLLYVVGTNQMLPCFVGNRGLLGHLIEKRRCCLSRTLSCPTTEQAKARLVTVKRIVLTWNMTLINNSTLMLSLPIAYIQDSILSMYLPPLTNAFARITVLVRPCWTLDCAISTSSTYRPQGT